MMIIITNTITATSIITIKVIATTNTKTALGKIAKPVFLTIIHYHSRCHYHHKNRKTSSSRFYNFKLRHY